MAPRPLLLACLLIAAGAVTGAEARADGPVPASTELPQMLTMDEALHIFRTRGLELLIADSNVRSAEGAVNVAGAVPNPGLSGTWGKAFTYSPNDPSCGWGGGAGYGPVASPGTPGNYAKCGSWSWNVTVTDNSALEDTLSGKRDLRFRVARNALAAAKMSRRDAERTLSFQVESAYLQVAHAVLTSKFAKDVADSNVTLLEKVKIWLAQGKSGITDADVARMETQKSESDQALDTTQQTLRQARVALAFLLGVRGEVPNFDVDVHALDYSVPPPLAAVTEVSLLRAAFDHRPDLIAAGYNKYSAEAALALVRRQKFPDIALSLGYTSGGLGSSQYGGSGTNAPSAEPTFIFGVSGNLPVFYQLQGETRQAEATLDTNTLQHAMTTKQVVSDVDNAYAAFVASQKLVNRMEKGEPDAKVRSILESAKVALDITRLQWERGAASLTDFLLALQTYIATKVEYYGDLTNYWTAVYQLEEAVATELHR
jgi:cobalt-zinc-cadmium efflux system outer membrane protein